MSEGRPYQICKRCIMDTSDPLIEFDADGFCNHCTEALQRMAKQLLPAEQRDAALAELVGKVKEAGRGKPYDCVIGVSGGVDSTFVAYKVREAGLRPLAVHFDNGWNTELAVANIKAALDALDIDLITYVVDWEEFSDLQLSFLRASVANAEAPTDHGLTALLFRTVAQQKLRHLLSGSNLVSEAILPYAWSHYNQDLRLLRAVHRRFGTVPLRSEPTQGIIKYLYYVLWKRIRKVPFLNYVEYHREEAAQLLTDELGWRHYGGKHCESIWTRFFQRHYLPTKFGYDKRRCHLSTLICSEQITRDEALAEMEEPLYDPDLLRQDIEFVKKKFQLSDDEYDEIMTAPIKWAQDYPSNYFLFHKLVRYKNLFRRIATTP